MFAELNRCRDLFLKFGGHKMAAGRVTSRGKRGDVCGERLNENCDLSWEDMSREDPYRYETASCLHQRES